MKEYFPTAASATITLLRLHFDQVDQLRSFHEHSFLHASRGMHYLFISGFFRKSPLLKCDGRYVQSLGTYSPKRSDLRLLTIPASWARVAELNPYWDAISSLAPDYSFASFCAHHCSTCVALPIRAMRTWRHPHLPSTFSRLSIMHREWHNTRVALVNELNLTSHDTSWRQPCSTCFRIMDAFLHPIQKMSRGGKVLRVMSN